MQNNHPISRRKFVASASVLAAGAQLGLVARGEEPLGTKLAIDGGPKAVTSPVPLRKRWGEPELAQLGEAVKQPSLYYWRNKQTALFTERFRKFYPHKFVQPCTSGSAALHIAVAAAGIAPGDEVITSAITDIGTVIGILFQQAVPVFADLQPGTACLDPADVERKITPKTRAIIAVHLFGNPSRLNEIKEIAGKHKLILIEDCAQAWGALYKGKPVSTFGEIGCFSMQDSKHIACGDGGVVTSSDPRLGPLLTKFGDKGTNRFDPKDSANVLAANYRANELHMAFAAAQLTRLDEIVARRSSLGSLLTAELEGTPGIMTHRVEPEDRCVYWFYMLRLQPGKLSCDRTQFVKAVAAEGAPLNAGYIANPIYGMPMFRNHSFFAGGWPAKQCGLTSMDYSKVKLEETESILQTCMLFRLHEGMDESYVRAVAAAIRKVARHYAVSNDKKA
jgi:dTDP-4-amino-4,6-dideoxygalactose transaminase